MGRYKAVVFDLDGTLQDSKIDYQMMTERVRQVLLDEGVPEDSLGDRRAVYLIIRGGGDALLELGVENDRVPAVLDLMTEAMNETELEAIGRVEPKPNAHETLDTLHRNGILLGIATRSHRVYAEKCLANMGMRHYIRGMLARDDVPHSKPDPRHLYDTIALLDVDPGDVLYVGDTTTDLETARRAEVDFVGYKRDEAWGQRLIDAGCDMMAEDLLEIVEMALKKKE